MHDGCAHEEAAPRDPVKLRHLWRLRLDRSSSHCGQSLPMQRAVLETGERPGPVLGTHRVMPQKHGVLSEAGEAVQGGRPGPRGREEMALGTALQTTLNGRSDVEQLPRLGRRCRWNTVCTQGAVLQLVVAAAFLLVNQVSAQERVTQKLDEIEDAVDFIRKEVGDDTRLTRAMRASAIAIGATTNVAVAVGISLANAVHLNGRWSLRLWMLLQEWWYWLLASVLVTVALACAIVAFEGGEDVDTTILVLAAEMAVFIATFAVRAYQIHTRKVLIYKAWTGMSRSGRGLQDAWVAHMPPGLWHSALRYCQHDDPNVTPIESKFNPSNWVAWYTGKTRLDPGVVMDQLRCSERVPGDLRDIMQNTKTQQAKEKGYIDYYPQIGDGRLSILWGGRNSKLFQVRASRGIISYSVALVTETYSYTRESDHTWAFIAGGALARNKGLRPFELRFMSDAQYPTALLGQVEMWSSWYPRPAKTRRTKVHAVMKAQFGGLGERYVNAATELSLLMEDVDNAWLIRWFNSACEHQELATAWDQCAEGGEEWQRELYLCSYVSMMVSLNNGKKNGHPKRVDTLCTAVILIQERKFADAFGKLTPAVQRRIRYAVREDMDALAVDDEAQNKIVKSIVLYAGASDSIEGVVGWKDVQLQVGLEQSIGEVEC
ncbi:unnamed protein product [Ostreobium quekettii]|uniref:Uncharacterized protein n=1 Tax=Ostreobium quekettii TaxID=121088 RepID=A0A8S1IV62_9CHLO|nr:unnamed protein product [Ostreobium quekettii]|eukprot:evm.model.scf_1547EXC.4 EVM.evm.TU.scf_1547EXC.4   scf_1547EXC:34742-36990(-)